MKILIFMTIITFIPNHLYNTDIVTNKGSVLDYKELPKEFCQSIEDITQEVFMAVLKDEFDNVKATINDSTIFIVKKGQLFLYFNDPHTAFLANGQYAYIPPTHIKKVDSPYFKFNFSKWRFIKDNHSELYQTAKQKGIDLNFLIKGIQNKDREALLKYYKLYKIADGAVAEEFFGDFWALINLWTDKELSSFIMTLNVDDKKGLCQLLLESSFCNPKTYYKLYYPSTLKEILTTI